MRIEEIFKKHFDWSEEEISKKGKLLQNLYISESHALDMAEFYQQEFGVSREKFISMLKSMPNLLNYSEECIKLKSKFYQQEFGLSKVEFIDMVKELPVLLTLSEESLREKHRGLQEIGLSKEYLVEQPNILTVPINTLKLRYDILRQIASREQILSRDRWYITSQNKSYARMKFFEGRKLEYPIMTILLDERRFVKKYGVTSSELMERFKLTPEVIHNMKKSYISDKVEDFGSEEKESAMI